MFTYLNVAKCVVAMSMKQKKEVRRKKFGPFLDLCVSSLRRGHANLLCIVPILSDVPEGTHQSSDSALYKVLWFCALTRCGTCCVTPLPLPCANASKSQSKKGVRIFHSLLQVFNEQWTLSLGRLQRREEEATRRDKG